MQMNVNSLFIPIGLLVNITFHFHQRSELRAKSLYLRQLDEEAERKQEAAPLKAVSNTPCRNISQHFSSPLEQMRNRR